MGRTLDQFIERHGLWNPEQKAAAADLVKRLESDGIRNVRIAFGDQHGILRGKTLTASEFKESLRNGKDFQSVIAILDTTNHLACPPFGSEPPFGMAQMIGLPDGVLVPDPTTYCRIPWVEDTAWCLGDSYFADGEPCPLYGRHVLNNQVSALAADGLSMMVGLELEFYIFKLLDPQLSPEKSGYPPVPPSVEMISHGYNALSDTRNDEVQGIMSLIQENIQGMGLPIATLEGEWGPGQVEVTFAPMPALRAADAALLFRTTVKQLCRRQGLHATFMAVPQVPSVYPSGWHLHQSLVDANGENVFVPETGTGLSVLGMNYVGGLLDHAAGTSLLTTPTVNGYKRQRPDSFAPMNVSWALENRGAMLRIIGDCYSSASRVENRVGEPTANPYLYMASQIIAGRDGMAKKTDPGEPVVASYTSDRPILPTNILEAIEAFQKDDVIKAGLGDAFHTYFTTMKKAEAARFMATVTDWEQNEYFEMM